MNFSIAIITALIGGLCLNIFGKNFRFHAAVEVIRSIVHGHLAYIQVNIGRLYWSRVFLNIKSLVDHWIYLATDYRTLGMSEIDHERPGELSISSRSFARAQKYFTPVHDARV